MAEKFKALADPVRLATTEGGHTVVIGEDFVEVPAVLVPKALASGCIAESMYNKMRADIEKEVKGSKAEKPKDQVPPKEPETAPSGEIDPEEEREAKIVMALKKIEELKSKGLDETPSGKKLEYKGNPRVDAVSELAGIKVMAADIEAILKSSDEAGE